MTQPPTCAPRAGARRQRPGVGRPTTRRLAFARSGGARPRDRCVRGQLIGGRRLGIVVVDGEQVIGRALDARAPMLLERRLAGHALEDVMEVQRCERGIACERCEVERIVERGTNPLDRPRDRLDVEGARRLSHARERSRRARCELDRVAFFALGPLTRGEGAPTPRRARDRAPGSPGSAPGAGCRSSGRGGRPSRRRAPPVRGAGSSTRARSARCGS